MRRNDSASTDFSLSGRSKRSKTPVIRKKICRRIWRSFTLTQDQAGTANLPGIDRIHAGRRQSGRQGSGFQYPLSEEYPVNSISLLSFFGAAGQEREGSMFVPDGSGALIHFNNGKTNIRPISSSYTDRIMTMERTEDAGKGRGRQAAGIRHHPGEGSASLALSSKASLLRRSMRISAAG